MNCKKKVLHNNSKKKKNMDNLHFIPNDDGKKISRLNAPGFNGLVIAWKA